MRIAFCKFAGLANGGVEKYLQTIALIYKKTGHEVDYYYTNAAPITSSGWVHPDNDTGRENLMIENGINLIPVHVDSRHHNEWIGTDFFDKFDESKYDLLMIGGNGESEFPYNRLHNIKIIHTVHGDHLFNQSNVVKYVLLCNWQAKRWLNNGGDGSKLNIIPTVVYVPEQHSKSMREIYGIPKDAFVYGLHQRNDLTISSTLVLEAFSRLVEDGVYFALLGGTEIHKNYVRENGIKNVIFCDYTSDINEIHSFLDGLDVYTHCRIDGEVCSAAIIEAMSHYKPIVSYPGHNMGHAEQIDGCGIMTYSLEQYTDAMIKLRTDYNFYDELSQKTKEKYHSLYDFRLVENKIISLINNIL